MNDLVRDYVERIGGPVGVAADDGPRYAASRSSDFKRDERGSVIAGNLDNIRIGLVRLGIRPVFDEFSRDIRISGRPVDDIDVERLWVSYSDAFGWRPSRENLRTMLVSVAHAAVVHPVREYLDSLVWDGRPRLATWLIQYGGAPDSPYVRAASTLPLIAAVRRVRAPGAKFDELPILEGDQGTGKSTGLRALCPNDDWFSDDLPLGVDSKQIIERTAGRWLIEAAELHGNRGREAEALKAFLSRQVDGPVRLAYGRMPTTVPRQFILIGTTNSRLAYLKDSTGARRFWPVAIQRFDVEALARDRDQLWAEAGSREASRASIRLDPALYRDATAAQENRRAADPWEVLLEPLLEGDGVVAVEHVAVAGIWDALKLEGRHLDNRHADRVAAIVQRYGFTHKRRKRVNGKPELCWVRSADDGDDC